MAARTSVAAGGNWSNTATWVEGAVPGAGDTVTIAAPSSGVATVVVDVDTTVGNSTDGTADTVNSITINGTSPTVYGKLQVADGVTLTMTGDATMGTLTGMFMRINRYAVFEPLPGSTIIGSAWGDGTNYIDNRGHILAVGTSDKRIKFGVPASTVTWNTAGSITSGGGNGEVRQLWEYHRLYGFQLGGRNISNAAGTGPGDDSAAGSSSVVISNQKYNGVANTYFVTRKAWISDANGLPDYIAMADSLTDEGDYALNHAMGFAVIHTTKDFYYLTANTNYTMLNAPKRWGIRNVQNTADHSAQFAYCDFEHMGPSTLTAANGADQAAISLRYKYSDDHATAGGQNRLFRFDNNTVKYSSYFFTMRNIEGTATSPISIQNNVISGASASGGYESFIYIYRAANSYLKINNNTILNLCIRFDTYGGPYTQESFAITNNKVFAQGPFWLGGNLSTVARNANISYNLFRGNGAIQDNMLLQPLRGASDGYASVHDNLIEFVNRAIIMSGYINYYRNTANNIYHHNMMMGTSNSVLYIPGLNIYNNYFWGRGTGSNGAGLIQMGYNNNVWIDGLNIYNNTVASAINGIEFGDSDVGTSSGTVATLITGVSVYNNLVHDMSLYSFKLGRGAYSILYNRTSVAAKRFDYNLAYGYTTPYELKSGTFTLAGGEYSTATRNVAGVYLSDPSYATPQTNKSLVYTRTSATDQTLSWAGGTPVQLVFDSGTITTTVNVADSDGIGYGASLSDTSKTWQSTMDTTPGNPACMWVLITSGAGAGQVRALMRRDVSVASKVYVVPAWTTTPAAGDTYAILRSHVQLFDSGGTESVYAGIDLRELPGTSQTDTGIGLEFHRLEMDPQIIGTSASTDYTDFTPANADLTTAGYGGTAVGALAVEVDTVPPTITVFTLSATSESLTVPLTFTATDAFGVVGWYVSETGTLAGDETWLTEEPTSYIFATEGGKTLYGWAKDAAGNISEPSSSTTVIAIPDVTPPEITAFTLPATADSITLAIASLTATDAVGVTGYYLLESDTTPAVDAAGWVAAPPTTFELNETQTRTVYAWAKDAAGNISDPVAASVDVTLTGAAAGDPMYVYHDGNWILVGTLVTYPPA